MPNMPFCTMLFVDRSRQKKGYGKALMKSQRYDKIGCKDCGGSTLDIAGYEQPMELIMMKDLRTGRVK